MYSDEPHVLEALRAGAMAYVLKGTSTETLIFALREAMAGRRYLSPPLSDRAVEVISRRSARRSAQRTAMSC